MHNQDEMLRDILLELIELRQENKFHSTILNTAP